MYSLVLIIIAIVSSMIWFRNKGCKKWFRLDTLAIVSGSAGLMFLVDDMYKLLEEGVLIEVNSESLFLTIILVISTIVISQFTSLISSKKFLVKRK